MSEVKMKSCPFCGGEANLQDDYCSEFDETRWMVWHLCEDGPKGEFVYYDKPACLSIETPWFDSREKAIEAWNVRAERTCHNVSKTGNFRCSECDATDLDFTSPDYCHGCGAKVVNDEK